MMNHIVKHIPTLKNIRFLLVFLCYILITSNSFAGNRFASKYPCHDQGRVCTSGAATRKVDGFDVYKPCWEYSYVKTCNYPSKNDCRLYAHCYAVANKECLLKDSMGYCVNLKREFSCKSWITTQKENKEARVDLVEKEGEEKVVCKGVPCIDGNCVDKSYLTNGEMMDAVSKLHSSSHMKPDKDHNFSLFAGFQSHCSKKAAGYSNCCPETAKGWGKQLGAKCTKDEVSLMKLREKNLCVYVGKENKGKFGVVVKHKFCCFGNMLEKVVQVEGRKQLGIDFGNGKRPNCRGLTIEEITGYDKHGNKVGNGLDFSKMDFSDFVNELMVKFTGTYKTPNPEEIAATIKAHMNIKEYDGDENNPDNRFAGLNKNIKDDSWEAEEERRIEQERLERESKEQVAKIAAEKQRKAEAERLAKIEAERQEKLQRINRKKQEIALAESKYEQAVRPYYAFLDRHSNSRYEISRHKHQPWYPELMRLWQIQSNAQSELSRLKREFSEIEQ
ncbi:conjugal transfer protein TraN [Rickettsiaceae bacterium]|nr:conjugal transfer protein TraN [Rickettsiaceae bacterium]